MCAFCGEAAAIRLNNFPVGIELTILFITILECTLAPFVSGSSAEKIPFVFLPLRGQIIHPSKEISFQGKYC